MNQETQVGTGHLVMMVTQVTQDLLEVKERPVKREKQVTQERWDDQELTDNKVSKWERVIFYGLSTTYLPTIQF